jgi:methanogenic corrinoid protein MtbC1
MDLARRSALAGELQKLEEVPLRVSDAFYARHAAWAARAGEAGRLRCVEDARFHLSFLAGAVQAGSQELFADYAGWAAAVLEARAIGRDHLAELLGLLGEGLAEELPEEESALVQAYLEAARVRVVGATPAPAEAPDARTPVRVAYLSAALAGKRREAYAAVRGALRAGWPIADVYRDLLLHSQTRLGELWARGKINVAQEHIASGVTQWVLPQLYAELAAAGSARRGRALITGVEGELHALPAYFVADLLQIEGWDAVLVGTHVPLPAILSSVDEHEPDVVGVSTTMVSNVPETVALVGAVREKFPALRVVLGGRALRGAEHLGAELGVEIDARGDLAPLGATGS